jgi:predicted metal-dependent hydrolase
MKKHIFPQNKKVTYMLRKSRRAKRMRLAVYCDGSVVVTAPVGVRQSVIDKFLADKTRWVIDKLGFFKGIDSKAIRTFSEEDYLMHKEKALALVRARIRVYNKIYGFSFKGILIKNQKTRWGSCSKAGNININYKVLFLPKKLRDYVVVHELCHLKEFNHSRKFWALVAKALPDYLEIKNELRDQGLLYI